MQLTYTIVSTNHFKNATTDTLTVGLGTASSANTPSMPAFSFPIANPQASDLASYVEGAQVTVTIAPVASTTSAG